MHKNCKETFADTKGIIRRVWRYQGY